MVSGFSCVSVLMRYLPLIYDYNYIGVTIYWCFKLFMHSTVSSRKKVYGYIEFTQENVKCLKEIRKIMWNYEILKIF